MSLIAFILSSFFTFGAPSPDVQNEIDYQNCAGTWDPDGCRANL